MALLLSGVGCTKSHTKLQVVPKPLLTLTVNGYPSPIYVRPPEAYIVGRLTEPLDCPAIFWDFGDGSTASSVSGTCDGSPLVYARWHRYRSYGVFRPTLRLVGRNGSVLAVGAATVTVQPPE